MVGSLVNPCTRFYKEIKTWGAMRPYEPGLPADPASFAGRAELVQAVRLHLEEARGLRRSSALLLQGYRGSGKTSAIRKIEAMVQEEVPGTLAVELQLRAQSSENYLLLSIVKDIHRQLEGRKELSGRLKEWLGRIGSVSIAGTGVTLGPKRRVSVAEGLTLWKSCVEALEKEPLLLVCIDDAELLDTRGLGTLKTIAESRPPVPVILVVAGGVELWDRLSRKDASPVVRIFSGAVFDIGEFTLDETREAVEVPVARVGGTGRWTEDGIREVHSLSHGYPYLVQCLAAATYSDGTDIGAVRVRERLPEALRVGAGWLDRESVDLSEEDVRAFAKIAASGKGTCRTSEILGLGIRNVYIDRLIKEGILRKVSRGRYELRKAPAIAYYHALRRGISW